VGDVSGEAELGVEIGPETAVESDGCLGTGGVCDEGLTASDCDSSVTSSSLPDRRGAVDAGSSSSTPLDRPTAPLESGCLSDSAAMVPSMVVGKTWTNQMTEA
jgi:hypothetical protein